jgi:hypothetical protein
MRNAGMLASNRNNGLVHRSLAGGRVSVSNRVINVANSGQLLDLLDNAAPASAGKITVPASNRRTHSKNSDGDTANARNVRDHTDNPRLMASARSSAP